MSELPDLKRPATADDIPTFLTNLFARAVEAAAPHSCLPRFLPEPPKGRTLVVAIGKAAAAMAQTVEDHWSEKHSLSGFALTRYGHGAPCARIEVVEASHPVPDDRGHQTTRRIMDAVAELTSDDLLLFLVSGGGSALMTMPAQGIDLSEKKSINRSLLLSGAPIGEMNIVRKHLSAVKGGRLAQLAAPARIVTLAISDVPGDDPSTIASGPTVPDESTCADALAILARYGIAISPVAQAFLNSANAETPKPGDSAFTDSAYSTIMRPGDALEAVAAAVESTKLTVRNLGADVEGEARAVAAEHARLALAARGKTYLILSGGETTVTVEKDIDPGKGGRNCEYLLALAIALDGAEDIHAVAADTDGIDGSETNAGAIITPDTLSRGAALGLDASDHLRRHDSFSYFEALGSLVTTGPTRTNVNDFRAIWTGPVLG